MPYFEQIYVFGDGRNGAATQVYKVIWAEDQRSKVKIDTGIWLYYRREFRHDDFQLTVKSGGEVFETKAQAINIWAAANGKEPLDAKGTK